MVSSGMAAAGYTVRQHRRLLVQQQPRRRRQPASPTPRSSPTASRRSPTTCTARASSSASTPSAGTTTCAGYPGQPRPRAAATRTPWASWGVDYLKYDNCDDQGATRPAALHRHARRAGRHRPPDPLRDVRVGREQAVDRGAPPVGNSWRTTGDISDNWNSACCRILDQQRRARRRTPARATGTTRTCSRSATAA